MSILITKSENNMFFDTLPAIKITNYNSGCVYKNIYSYIKCYIYNNSLQICFSIFNNPSPENQMFGGVLAFNENKNNKIFFTCDNVGNITFKSNTSQKVVSNVAIKTMGQDEQGHYCNYEFEISKALLQNFKGENSLENSFLGNFFIFCNDNIKFHGSVFQTASVDFNKIEDINVDEFTIVDY